jgi:hypothetical protein
MSTVRRFMPDPAKLAFGKKGELHGIMSIPPALNDADLRTRIIELGRTLGPHAPEDHDVQLWVGRLPDGRLAVVPEDPFAGAAYAIETVL